MKNMDIYRKDLKMFNAEDEISGEELNKPLQRSNLPPLAFLPDREWLKAVITDVKYCRAMFNGQVQYLTRQVDGVTEDVIDPITKQKIERREYRITYTLLDFSLPNGKKRNGWVNLGSSLGKKANLAKYLTKLGIKNLDKIPDSQLPTPAQIIKFLKDKHVFIQFANVEAKEEGEEVYQRIVKDAIKLADKPHQIFGEVLNDLTDGHNTSLPNEVNRGGYIPAPEQLPPHSAGQSPAQNPFSSFAGSPTPVHPTGTPTPAWDD